MNHEGRELSYGHPCVECRKRVTIARCPHCNEYVCGYQDCITTHFSGKKCPDNRELPAVKKT